jgi:hypothetical protein
MIKTISIRKRALVALLLVVTLGGVISGITLIKRASAQLIGHQDQKIQNSPLQTSAASLNHISAAGIKKRAAKVNLDWMFASTRQPVWNNTLTAMFAPTVTATKTDSLVATANNGDGRADFGDTIGYTVTIGANGEDALGVMFNDTPDINTTLVAGSVMTTPLARNDSFTATGNIRISIPAASGALANDNDADGVGPALTATATATSAQGGNVSMSSDGGFTYNPPAGFEGTDTFTYTVNDGEGNTDTATVSITVSGMIWFINNNGSSAGDGRLTSPFNTLAAFNAVNNGAGNNPAANEPIFVYESATAYTGGVTLLAGQKLIGQDSTSTLAAITGIALPSFSDAFPAMNTGAPATTIQNAAGNGITLGSGNTLNGLTASNSSAAAISGTSFGTLTVADVIINSSGAGLSLNTGTFAGGFISTTSTGGTNNVSLVSVTGTVNLGSGALSGSSGIALAIGGAALSSGGTGNINYSGTINNTTSRVVSVRNKSAGTVALSGAINGTGTGVFLDNNTGATINFTGGLTLNTGTSAAFTATGGGTIHVTQNNTTIINTLTTTTGTALNVANTTIGAAGLNFRSISSNGAPNGILLNNTGSSGGLTVAGNGGTCTSAASCTGGTIQNTTGHGVSLTTTRNVSFDRVNIQNTSGSGVDGTAVINFSFTNGVINNSGTGGGVGTSNIAFNDSVTFQENNVSGTVTITGNTLSNPHYHGVEIFNWAGLLDYANVSGNTITAKSGGPHSFGSAIGLIARGENVTSASVTRANLDNNTVQNGWLSVGIQAQGGHTGTAPAITFGVAGHATNVISISGNTLTAPLADPFNAEGILAVHNHAGQANFKINNNGTAALPIGKTKGTAISNSAFGNVTVTSEVKNNYIAPSNIFSSQGIGIGTSSSISPTSGGNVQTPNMTVAVENNNISQTDGAGILAVAIDASGLLKIAIKNNIIGARASSGGQSLVVRAGGTNGDNDVCLDISGNTSAPPAGFPEFLGIGLRKQGTSPTANAFGIEGMAATASPGVESYVNGLNPNGGGTLLVSGTSGFSNCSSAPRGAPVEEVENKSKDEFGIQSAPESQDILWAIGDKRLGELNIPSLTQDELQSFVQAALERWKQSGISDEDFNRLQGLSFEIADLEDGQLSSGNSRVVRISPTAAGHGWYLDPIPLNDVEFNLPVVGLERQSTERSPAFGRMDLLTVIARALGNALGKEKLQLEGQQSLMQNALGTGVRRALVTDWSPPDETSPYYENTVNETVQYLERPTVENLSTQTVETPQAQKPLSSKTRSDSSDSPDSGTPVSLNIGTLPAGKSVTIKFNVTVNNDITAAQLSNQGTVSGSNFSNVVTDDPDIAGAANPTVTNVDLPNVTVAVAPASVAEDGSNNLVYTFTREGSTTNSLTVNFSVAGTATFSTDYAQTGAATFDATTGTVVIPAGSSTATVTVDPTADTAVEADETAILTVTTEPAMKSALRARRPAQSTTMTRTFP